MPAEARRSGEAAEASEGGRRIQHAARDTPARLEDVLHNGATVYLLRSERDPAQPYIGVTQLRASHRLQRHNAGDVPSTARYRPWRLVAAFWFEDQATANRFERYLKSGSGRAFAKRHFGAE